jgi:hypothetical protein
VLKWATTEATPAYSQDPTLFDLDELFNYKTGIEEYAMNDQYPKSFLMQNYPNPFNPTTTIAFYLTGSEFVSLAIYNTVGKKVTTLVSQKLDRGFHRYNWSATGLPGGVYFYRIQTSSINQTRKLTLLK